MKEQTEVKNLKEGRYVIIDDEVCTIKAISKSKPGQKRSIVHPVSTKIFVPIVERKNAQVLSVAGDVVQLMDMTDYTTFELPIPADYKDRVVEGNEIQYITALGKIRLDMR